MINKPLRYHHTHPESEPSRYSKAIERQKRLQLIVVRHLRRKKKFREDKKRVRYLIGIPPDGYGVREARKKLSPLSNAYIECQKGERGNYKKQGLAGAWLAMLRIIRKFADEYRLSRGKPMPLHIAFSEIIFKYHKPKFRLRGYFYSAGESEPLVLLEDGETKPSQPIERMIIYRLRGDDNDYTKQIRIFNRDANPGRWEIR